MGQVTDGSPGSSVSPSAREESRPPADEKPPRPRTKVYVVVGVAIVVAMIVFAYVLTDGFRSSSGSSGSDGKVLVPRGTSYSMIIGQYNGINFVISSASHILGEVNSSRGVQLYILTPDEFHYLVKNLTVGQYVWTSGVVANQTIYDMDISVQPGQWVLSFVNPSLSFPTGVTFYSDVTLSTA